MLGPHFIDVGEITDVSEELQESEEEEQDNNEKEELRRKLTAVKTKYRQERELHDHMFEHGLELEKLINEMAAENEYLTSRMKEFQQQMANIRKMWEESDEETFCLKLLSEEQSTKSQLIYIRGKEREIQKLREKNEELTAEMARLSEEDKHREEIQYLEIAEQLCKKFATLTEKNNKCAKQHFTTIQDLIQEQREEEGQEEQIIAAAYLQNESKTLSEQRQPQGSSAVGDDGNHKDERPLETERWHRCVKVAGYITLCVLLSVGLMVHMVPDCISPNPDCNLFDIAYDLLAPYCNLFHTNSSGY